MVTLSFETLRFEEKNDQVKVIFLRMFTFNIPKDELDRIGTWHVGDTTIEFSDASEKKVNNKFNQLLFHGFSNLTNILNGKKTVYVHQQSGIPIIGNIAFGLIDRGTNIIEVKPITGCNIKCVYCSVNEDVRPVDFVVEKDYLVAEFKRLVKLKGGDHIEAHIGGQSEPTLYADLIPLVADLAKIPQVKVISVDTNGTMLTNERIDALVAAGMNRFNFSLNAMDPAVAKKIANAGYDLPTILKTIKYIAAKTNLIIAPVWVPGFNDGEMSKIIEFVKQLKQELPDSNITLGIQNFLEYKFGRNPAKQKTWEQFYAELKELEQQHSVKLIVSADDYKILPAPELPKPFKKGDVVKARIIGPGRLTGEKLAVAQERTISLMNCDKPKGDARVKIVRSKHNIFAGVCL